MRKLLKHLPYWKLEINIMSIFLLLFIASFSVVSWYTYQKNKEIVIDYINTLMQQLSDQSTEKLNNLLVNIEDFSDIEKSMITTETSVSLENKELINYMFHALSKIPDLTVLHAASVNGTWIGIFTLLPNTSYRTHPRLLPSNYKYALQYVNRNGKVATEEWIYLDEDEKIQEIEKIDPVNYDPRVRPWFQEGLKLKKPYWTDVFMFVITKDPGITYAYPIFDKENKIIAIAGGDVELRFLSNFMHAHKIGTDGSAMLLNKKGSILASSDELPTNRIANIRENPLYAGAYEVFLKKGQRSFLYEHQGKEYITSFAPFISKSNEDWTIAVFVPSKDFLAPIQKIQDNLYILFAGIILLTIALTMLFSKRISKPIVSLSNEIDHLQKLDLNREITTKSHVKEIHRMTESIIALKSALQSFVSYVPKELVRHLLQRGRAIELGGTRKEITIFFSDIFDFTSISESLSTEKVMEQLEEYFSHLSTIILSHKGTIDKYIGDAIMAFWGAPDDVENHPHLAAEAALLCQAAIDEMNEKWIREGKNPFYTRIGLHTGTVIVGNIGTDERMNYTIVGDAVNLASRLEGINKVYKTKIIISETVAQHIKNEFLLRPLDIVAVKGKLEKVKIYELMGKLGFALSADQIDLSKRFTEAFEYFEKGDHPRALKLFLEIEKIYPYDIPTKLLMERLHSTPQ